MLEQILEWDRDTFIYLNSLGIEKYDVFWVTVTQLTTWIPLFIFFFFLLYRKHSKKEAIVMMLVSLAILGIILLTMQITKESVARLRPNNDLTINSVIRILKSPSSYSFFSGHAATSFGLTTLIVLFLRKKLKWVWLFYLWPLLFAFSRIYVGVHYPVDILVGVVVGLFYAFLFYRFYGKFIAPKIESSRPL